MPRSDWVQLSAPRVELDQRSREARLRLEHAERLLVVRPLPKQSLLRRVLRRLGLRIYVGEHVAGQSGRAPLTRGRPRQGRRMPSETGGVGSCCCTAPLVSWPEFPEGARMASVRSDPGVSSSSLTVQGNLALGARRVPCARRESLRDWRLAGRQSEVRTSWD
jgi:hypothetical protein